MPACPGSPPLGVGGGSRRHGLYLSEPPPPPAGTRWSAEPRAAPHQGAPSAALGPGAAAEGTHRPGLGNPERGRAAPRPPLCPGRTPGKAGTGRAVQPEPRVLVLTAEAAPAEVRAPCGAGAAGLSPSQPLAPRGAARLERAGGSASGLARSGGAGAQPWAPARGRGGNGPGHRPAQPRRAVGSIGLRSAPRWWPRGGAWRSL